MKKITFLFLTVLLTLASWRTSAQWSENFDAGTTLPAGWTIANGGGANGWVVLANPTGGAHSGTNVASITYNTTAHDDYLITPSISVTAGVSDRISFFIKSRSSSYLEPYEVKLSTTGTAASDFTVTLQTTQEAPNAWTQNTFNLTSYVGQTIYVAVHATGTDEWQLFVDDFVNSAIPTCPAPTGLSASGITSNSANLSWTAGGSETSWNIEYGATGFTHGSGTIVNNVTNPYSLISLNSATTYDYYVQSNCTSDTSIWSGPYTFTTLCTAQTLPYFTDFNTNMNCWSVENANADTQVWKRYNNTAPLSCINEATTDFVLGVAYNSTLNANDFAFSPGFQLQSGTNYTLSFSYGNDGGTTYTENMTVYLCSAANSTSALAGTQLFTQTAISGGCNEFLDNGITVSSNGVYYIAFHATSPADMDIVMIDDFSFMETPACPAPTALNLVSKTATSATFGWTAGASETQWDIEWGPEGFTQGTGTLVTGVTSNPYTLNGLTYGTHYSAYVRANCGSGSESTWVGPLTWFYIDFAECATLVSPADAATNVPVGSVTFEWTPSATGEPAVSYNLYYGLTSTTVTNLVGNYTTTSDDINVSGYGTTFYWQIRPVNAAGETQGCPIWSFTTESSPFLPYCGPLAYSTSIEPITLVNFAGINNTTSEVVDETPEHENFISIQGNVEQGGTYPIVLKGNTGGNFTNRFVVFIDWNQNNTLNDAGEVYFGDGLLTIINSTGVDAIQAAGDIIVPTDALTGVTRMRVKKLYGTTNTADPCSGASYGQAEDYSVNVSAPASLSDNVIDGFSMYPNPVNNSLNLKALNNIDAISIYNMLGQELMRVNPSSTQVQLDMTQISIGSYVVKVQSGAQVGAYSLIKQ